MSARHEKETLQEYHERLKLAKKATKARLRGLLVHDSLRDGTYAKPKGANT